MKRFFVIIFTLFFILPGCGDKPSVSAAPDALPPPSSAPDVLPETAVPAINAANFPVIDGSTATIPLGNAVMSKFSPGAEELIFSGTNNAYLNLLEGRCDIVLAYEPPDAVLEYMQMQNMKLEMAPIGRDALVFLINRNNPVGNLTTAQIQDIYTGEITNWAQAGGMDTAIKAYQRNSTSGSQTLMKKLVMDGLEMVNAPTEYVIGEMGTLVDAIATYNDSEYAIGYNVYYYVSQMRNNELIKLLSVDGVIPENDSIQSSEYPFVNDFYAAVRTDEPENSAARLLFDWLQSTDGQVFVRNEGYVPAAVNP